MKAENYFQEATSKTTLKKIQRGIDRKRKIIGRITNPWYDSNGKLIRDDDNKSIIAKTNPLVSRPIIDFGNRMRRFNKDSSKIKFNPDDDTEDRIDKLQDLRRTLNGGKGEPEDWQFEDPESYLNDGRRFNQAINLKRVVGGNLDFSTGMSIIRDLKNKNMLKQTTDDDIINTIKKAKTKTEREKIINDFLSNRSNFRNVQAASEKSRIGKNHTHGEDKNGHLMGKEWYNFAYGNDNKLRQDHFPNAEKLLYQDNEPTDPHARKVGNYYKQANEPDVTQDANSNTNNQSEFKKSRIGRIPSTWRGSKLGVKKQSASIADTINTSKIYDPDNTPSTPKGGFPISRLKGPEVKVYKSDTRTNYQKPSDGKDNNSVSNNNSAEDIASVVNKQTPEEQKQTRQIATETENIKKKAENAPKSWIGQKIKALRDLYGKWLKKKNEEHDSGKIGFFSNILRIIANCIDWLLEKLQNFAG